MRLRRAHVRFQAALALTHKGAVKIAKELLGRELEVHARERRHGRMQRSKVRVPLEQRPRLAPARHAELVFLLGLFRMEKGARAPRRRTACLPSWIIKAGIDTASGIVSST